MPIPSLATGRRLAEEGCQRVVQAQMDGRVVKKTKSKMSKRRSSPVSLCYLPPFQSLLQGNPPATDCTRPPPSSTGNPPGSSSSPQSSGVNRIVLLTSDCRARWHS
ncbi:MAG TPA: hypothetical protein VGO47_05910 [Chlamydiales bacterium]|nr:hypothetical protein [Chlamydiales bacterium]